MEAQLHTPETIYSRQHFPSWILLAAAAGAVNGFIFILCEQFVTHVTGTVTRLGLELPHAILAAEYAGVFVCFILGAATSVLAIQGRARKKKAPLWALPLVGVASILFGVVVAGQLGAFGDYGPFGGILATDEPPVLLLSLLAFAMGLQNATVSTATGNAVRSTHMTGPASDLGVHLMLSWVSTGEDRKKAVWAVALRWGKICGFIAGAGLSVAVAPEVGFLMLLMPAIFVLSATALSFTAHRATIEQWFAKPSDTSSPAGTVAVAPA